MVATIRIVAVVVVLGAVGFGAFTFLRGSDAQGPCAVTVAPGGDIDRAVADAPAGVTVCLAAGIHRPVNAAFAGAGVTLRGAGADSTIIQAGARDGVDVGNVERFTLADVTVRAGSPAGIYAARARGLTLRGVRVESAAIGVHVEGGTVLDLEDVTITGTKDFGLLVRRGASAAGRQVRVLDTRGIGVGAVDTPGPVSLSDTEITRAADPGRGEGMVLNGFERFTLTNVIVHGGNPAGVYVANAREFTARGLRVEAANFGLHLDFNANAMLDGVDLAGSTGVGLLLQRGGTLDGRRVHVLDTTGTGVSAINGAGLLTLRDSEIGRVAAAGLFAGVAGCEDLPPASLEVPACFYQDIEDRISTERVVLERVQMHDTHGPCLVFFAGVRAQVRDSMLTRCELTGLFAWGAEADVSGTTFEDNAEHALEYRAFPDPRRKVLAAASGAIEDSIISSTRPLEGPILGAAGPGPVLGGGILAQGARLTLRHNEVRANRDIGISFVNRSSGVVAENRILDNGNFGLCILSGSTVEARANTIAGNRSDAVNACGGVSLSSR